MSDTLSDSSLALDSRPAKKTGKNTAPSVAAPSTTGTTPLASLLQGDRALLAPALSRFSSQADLRPADLAAELGALLDRHTAVGADDPLANPVLLLAGDISRRIAAGLLDAAALEQLIQYLAAEGFLDRAERFGRRLGECDPAVNAARLSALLERLAHPEEASATLGFEQFRALVESELFGIVITAHPTFNLSGDLMVILTSLATGQDADGQPLSQKRRAELVQKVANGELRPDHPMTLDREHDLSLHAIGNIQVALRQVHDIVFRVAAELYPTRWTELTPRLITVASWVGYDLDGRSDIKWTDSLHKRLKVQLAQLRHYRSEVEVTRAASNGNEELRHTLEQIESRLALAIHEVTDEIAAFTSNDPAADQDDHRRVQRIARRMHDGRPYRLVDASTLIDRINRAIQLMQAVAQSGDSASTGMVRRLCVLRAELAGFGLGMAHTHVRINATQLHNSIRKAVGLESAPDDPRYRQSLLERITQLLDRVEPVQINFGSLITERTSAKRLFMIVAQMLKYSDASTPIRFLVAECEAPFTLLVALYYARLFGVADRLDISPLFETERALEVGSRLIDTLLENPHYRAQVIRRGRLCIQTGYSDAGRYLGQTPAAASIERLRARVARLLRKHGLTGVQLLIFDTHGESIGRGSHPGGFTDRLSYIAPPNWLALLAAEGISFKQEVSFQGGDGFQYFATPPAAFAVVTRILEYMMEGHRRNATPDPFYEENDYITEFFTTVKEFQVSLVRDPNYAVMLNAFGASLLPPSGSRAAKRQHDSDGDDIDQLSVSQTRAIPHNAILQQLGLPANVIGGIGAAIDKDPGRYASLYDRSPRFRQLIGIVEYGAAIADADALRAYVDTLDPGLWLALAAHARDPAHAEEMRRVANLLEDNPTHIRQRRVFRKLFADLSYLRTGLALTGDGTGALVTDRTRRGMRLLHATRIALIHELYRLATHIPDFSSQHSTTRERVLHRILHLDVMPTVAMLETIFPETPDRMPDGDYGEPASYVTDDSQNYHQENERLFRPMIDLYELIARTGTAMVQRIGFFG